MAVRHPTRRRGVPTLPALLLAAGLACTGSASASDRFAPGPSLGVRWLNSQPNARIVLHVVPGRFGDDSTAVCAALAPFLCQTGIGSATIEAPVSSAEQPYYFAYVLVANYTSESGFRGLQYGIEYDDRPMSGVDILDWTSCSVLEFPMTGWPHAGTGNLQTFFCETSGFTVAGYFTITVFGPDRLDLVERQNDGALKVADCASSETRLSVASAGGVGFGGEAGEDPCRDLGDVPIYEPIGDDPLLPPPPAPAQVLLHVVPRSDDSSNPCGRLGLLPCARGARSFRTEAPLTPEGSAPHVVYVLVRDGYPDRGVSSLWLGLRATGGVEPGPFHACPPSAEVTAGFPGGDGSARVYWGSAEGGCTPDGIAVAGWFDVIARTPGEIVPTAPAGHAAVLVQYCIGGDHLIDNDWLGDSRIGSAAFGGGTGRDPCYEHGWENLGHLSQVAVVSSTWGRIKALTVR